MARAERIPGYIKDLDVIVFQEAFDKDSRSTDFDKGLTIVRKID